MSPRIEPDLLTFNGIDATTGAYLQRPLTVAEASLLARGEAVGGDHLDELKARKERETEVDYGVVEGVDPKDLAQTGWGVIFPANHDPAIREALAPLLDLRRGQAAARKEQYYKEYIGVDAYRPNESKTSFLRRHGAGPGVADPEKAPYYMLLVGDPEAIPYRFQYQLDVQYAVGRIAFDTPEEYAQYAHSVVEAETGGLALGRRAAFFATANPGDGPTALSSSALVAPLAQFVAGDQPNWKVDTIAPEQATKARLGSLLGGAETPALLFTASHGMGFPKDDAMQFAAQGGLLCQDWPGPAWQQAIPPSFYFGGDDVSSGARMLGLIAMHFACYGAGTPQFDDYAPMGNATRAAIAPKGFLARLPQRLLAHPKGGALAVIGHVERAWGYSFQWTGAGRQIQTFQSTLKRLLEGHPVGSALEYFNSRYAELSSDLASDLEEIKYGKVANDYEIAGMWTANNDARSYAIIGDPAVRLNLAAEGAAESRPIMNEAIQVSPSPPAAPTRPAPSPAAHDAATPYGLLDPFRDAQSKLVSTLQGVVQQVGESLLRAVENLTATEVRTYVSDNLQNVKYDNGAFTNARLCAVTRLNFGGDTMNCVPTASDGKIDDALWKVHCDSVDKAIANRTEAIKLVTSAAASLLGVLKIT